MDEYIKQAEKFLKETNTTFQAEFEKNGLYFDGDEEPRDIYLITLKRGERIYKFRFGQSINNSGKEIKPTSYDVLSSLTKNEVGTFGDFCGDFGYDEDSRKAEKTFNAVQEEYKNVKMLWTDEEIEKLQEIE